MPSTQKPSKHFLKVNVYPLDCRTRLSCNVSRHKGGKSRTLEIKPNRQWKEKIALGTPARKQRIYIVKKDQLSRLVPLHVLKYGSLKKRVKQRFGNGEEIV